MTKKNLGKLVKTHRAMERHMSHITLKDKERNTWTRVTSKIIESCKAKVAVRGT